MEIKDECAGKWVSVLLSLGIPERYLTGKHGDCINCGDDRKNARWVRKDEYFICTKCGWTSPLDAAILWTGKDFKQVTSLIRGKGMENMAITATVVDSEKNAKRIKSILAETKRLTDIDPVSKYLRKRGINILPVNNVKYHPSMPFYHENKDVSRHPAMISILRNTNGAGTTLHVTYIDFDGNKANLEVPRKILPAALPIQGSCIQLFEPEDGIIAVGEGIETMLAVRQLFDYPVWAAGNAGQLEAMVFHEQVRKVIIFGDNDKSFTGQKSAYVLAHKLRRKIEVEVMIPPLIGDWCDELKK